MGKIHASLAPFGHAILVVRRWETLFSWRGNCHAMSVQNKFQYYVHLLFNFARIYLKYNKFCCCTHIKVTALKLPSLFSKQIMGKTQWQAVSFYHYNDHLCVCLVQKLLPKKSALSSLVSPFWIFPSFGTFAFVFSVWWDFKTWR